MKGTAHIVRGASIVPGAAPGATDLVGKARSAAAATVGHWFLSPDEGQVSVTGLELVDAAGKHESVPLTNCSPTYKASDAELSSMLDCPFTVPSGTYVGLNITVDTSAKVLINDTTNGLFTDPSSPTGLSLTAPDGGAQLVTLTVNANGNSGLTSETLFATPLVVGGSGDGGTEVEVTVLEDMIHTAFANVSGGQATFDTSLPLPPVALLATAGAVDAATASVEYYAPSGTAGDVNVGMGTGNEAGSVRVFYTSAGQPAFLWHVVAGPSEAWAANPARSTGGPSEFRAGGYLGLDATGTLCWALPSDFTYQSYSQLCRMKVVSSVGQTTTVECQPMSAVPPPTSGDTYASGCPAITPSSTEQVTLVAR